MREEEEGEEEEKIEEEEGDDFESSLLSFEKLDRASPDLWPEQLPGVAEFAASFKNPITNSPPKWMAELESEDIEMLKELGSLTTANLMEKVKGLQNLAYQLGLEEFQTRAPPSALHPFSFSSSSSSPSSSASMWQHRWYPAVGRVLPVMNAAVVGCGAWSSGGGPQGPQATLISAVIGGN
ncbi:hypothetical protein ACEWY4_005077 [Coilia grayii]|uniref:Protein lin-52 homolog n=1 Tax=Coilia grayii TaxID=363190 RepID=A0ABD1KHQ2_9TELE